MTNNNNNESWQPSLFQKVVNCKKCGNPMPANTKWMPRMVCDECLRTPETEERRKFWLWNALQIDKMKLEKIYKSFE